MLTCVVRCLAPIRPLSGESTSTSNLDSSYIQDNMQQLRSENMKKNFSAGKVSVNLEIERPVIHRAVCGRRIPVALRLRLVEDTLQSGTEHKSPGNKLRLPLRTPAFWIPSAFYGFSTCHEAHAIHFLRGSRRWHMESGDQYDVVVYDLQRYIFSSSHVLRSCFVLQEATNTSSYNLQ